MKILKFIKKKTEEKEEKKEITYKEIEIHLRSTQTWGTDPKVFKLFYEHIKLKTPVLEFQGILNQLPKKLFKLAYYYLVTQYWLYYSYLYPDDDHKNNFFYFLSEKNIRSTQMYHPATQKMAYFYLNKVKVVK